MQKIQELPGASPPGPLPGLYPGPAGGLTAPPDPQLDLAPIIFDQPIFFPYFKPWQVTLRDVRENKRNSRIPVFKALLLGDVT